MGPAVGRCARGASGRLPRACCWPSRGGGGPGSRRGRRTDSLPSERVPRRSGEDDDMSCMVADSKSMYQRSREEKGGRGSRDEEGEQRRRGKGLGKPHTGSLASPWPQGWAGQPPHCEARVERALMSAKAGPEREGKGRTAQAKGSVQNSPGVPQACGPGGAVVRAPGCRRVTLTSRDGDSGILWRPRTPTRPGSQMLTRGQPARRLRAATQWAAAQPAPLPAPSWAAGQGSPPHLARERCDGGVKN